MIRVRCICLCTTLKVMEADNWHTFASLRAEMGTFYSLFSWNAWFAGSAAIYNNMRRVSVPVPKLSER
jgi:hypothetical protein